MYYDTSPPHNDHPYNHPDYIQKFIENLQKTDLSKINFEQLDRIITSSIKSVPVIETTFKKGQYVARARKKSNGIPFNRLSKITLRDKSKVTSYGRAHRPNQAIFYCSSNHEVAIREATQWHITDFNVLQSRNMLGSYDPHKSFVTVSIWKVIEDIKVASLFLNESAVAKNPVVEYFSNSIKKDKSEEYNDKIIKSMNMLLEFFSNEFAKKEIRTESDYFISAFYANEVHQASEYINRLDGVVYPTIALDYEGENFALTEKAYKNKIQFVTAYHSYVANLEFKGRPMAIGDLYEAVELKGDIIIWKDLISGKLLPIDESP